MAEENLGTAVLRIVVDDEPARNALNLLKRDVEATARQADRTRRTATTRTTAKGGAREATDAVERANQRIIGVQNRINLLEAKGVDITQLRARLSQAIAANEQRNFGSVKQITAQLSNSLKIEEGRLRVSAAQTAELKRQQQVAPKERVTSQKPTGVGFATTPEQILASRGGIQKGAAESITALADAADKTIKLRNRINILEAKGVDVSKLQVQYQNLLTAGRANELGSLQRIAQGLKRNLDIEENTLRVNKLKEQTRKRGERPGLSAASQQAREASLERRAELRSLQTAGGGGGGLTNFLRDIRVREEGEKRIAAERAKGYKQAESAEKTLQALTEKRAGKAAKAAGGGLGKRAGGAIGSALIGGGFPLLFGQGVGAAAGGAVGGGIGGAIGGQFGFGLSIVGTIVGDAFDEALNKGKTLAAGLNDPIGKFGELQQAALLSSSAFEKNVAALIAQGRNAEAAALIQLDLAQRYGDTSELDGLRSAYDELGRAFSQLSVLTAKFVAGPLADFITKLSGALSAQSTQALLNERLANAPQAVRAEALSARRTAFKEASQAGTPGGAAITAGNLAALSLLDERLGKTKEVVAAEKAIATAVERQNKLNSLTTQQIQAQVQGYDLLNLQLEKQRIETQRLQDLQAAPKEQAGAINRKALEQTVRVEEQINNLLQERAAQQGLETVQNNIKLQSITKQVAATQALSKAERGVARDTLATTQNIQAGIDAAKDREREIGAQIDAARQRGGDAGEQEAFRLVQEQKVAANQTRLELEKGALALKEAGEQLRENLRGAVVEFTRVRSDPQGLNRFLNSQQRQERAEFDFQTLLPQFRQAQARFTELTGARAPEFTGSTAGVNAAIRDFINSVQNERQVTRDLIGTNQAIAINTAELNKTNADLAAKIKELADKDWTINLTQNSSGQWQASGDAQTQAELRAASTL